MAEPDWNPDTAGRPLAEILREAGIDTSRAARRRRWDDPDDTGIPQRRPDAPSDGLPGGFARRSSDLPTADPASRDRRAPRPDAGRGTRNDRAGRTDDRGADTGRVDGRRADSGRIGGVERRAGLPAPGPSTAAIPGLRPSRQPEVPGTAGPSAAPAPRNRRTADRTPPSGAEDARERSPRSGPQRPARTTTDDAADRLRQRAPVDEHFSTGPIPVVRDGDAPDGTDEAAGPRESALAWLRFAGELLIALAVGVGVYFLATVLWEQVPYLTVVLAPLAVTGLVGAVSLWRQRLGRGVMGARLLAVLVFAGALLTVAPAAELIGGG